VLLDAKTWNCWGEGGEAYILGIARVREARWAKHAEAATIGTRPGMIEDASVVRAIEQIAYSKGRRDEVPNQELARALARTRDTVGIAEIAKGLHHPTPAVRSDCIKVLYEIGYLRPELIAPYVSEFLELLTERNNRLVWGGMIALATISSRRAPEIWDQIDPVMETIERGTLITQIWGTRVLSGVASTLPKSRPRVLPALAARIETCDPRDLPLHAEGALPGVDELNRGTFAAILAGRLDELSEAQARRVRIVIRKLDPGR